MFVEITPLIEASPSSRGPSRSAGRLRTTNAIERLACELHRRTRVVTLLSNEASLLRLVSAMAVGISGE